MAPALKGHLPFTAISAQILGGRSKQLCQKIQNINLILLSNIDWYLHHGIDSKRNEQASLCGGRKLQICPTLSLKPDGCSEPF